MHTIAPLGVGVSRLFLGTLLIALFVTAAHADCKLDTSVIRDLIPFELGGTVDLVHAPQGVRCRLEIPAHWFSGSNAPSYLSNSGLVHNSMQGGQQF